MSRIELRKVNKYYDRVHVLKDIDLVIDQGDFMTLLGPSGCGKTTTLRVISGLENPQGGDVIIEGVVVAGVEQGNFVPAAKRNLNLVFQSYALWPHMTVFDNVAFGLSVRKLHKVEIEKKVMVALEKMQIAHYAERYPSELSGGQQQRVAIARAIVSEPKILLLDEPLSNLDAKLRVEMRAELKRLHNDLKTTIIYVTHDQVEALTLSTKIAVFFEGVLAQVDEPKEIYNNPVNIQVADFIGNPKINFIEGTIQQSDDEMEITSDIGSINLNHIKERNKKLKDKGVNFAESSEQVVLAIRPEHIHLSKEPVDNKFECIVYSVLPAGSETLVQLKIGHTEILAKEIGQKDYAMGDRVWITLDYDSINVYDKSSGKIILAAKK